LIYDRVAQTKRHTLRLIDIEQRYLQQQKTGKTGSRLQKNSKVLTNTAKQQNQKN